MLFRSIESNDLPPGFSVDQVQEILQTLRQGGRPELGDSIENGSLLWMPRGSLASENPIAPGAGDDLQVEPFIAAVAQRLAAFNVSTEVISELSSHIRKSSEAGAPMDKGEVRDYLEGLGVDVDKIMPQPKGVSGPSQPISPVVDPTLVTEPILESIIARLRKIGRAHV